MQNLTPAFASGSLSQLQQAVLAEPKTTTDGATYLADVLGPVDCVRYTTSGIAFTPGGKTISAPGPDEVLILTTSVSLCGTDLALIDKALAGKLPAEALEKVAGHEAAGIIVGVGAEVKNWQIGQIVNLDSHFACERHDHHSFDDCVASGLSCDGIAGGIRGAMSPDGATRLAPIDGYWSRVIQVSQSALPVEMPLSVAEKLLAPSTLESLGNIYMIVEQIEELGLLASAANTLCVVSGLGATGYPMAAVATHYGFDVVGINPSEGKRSFALEQKAVKAAYGTTTEAQSHVAGKENVIVVVTAGDVGAYNDALALLSGLGPEVKRKVVVAFGLFEDPTAPMPGMPAGQPAQAQRDFVFSRHSYTSDAGVEVYGVCGRSLSAWKRLMADLQSSSNLADMLNRAHLEVKAVDPLAQIANDLQQGSGHIKELWRANNKLKLVANLLTGATKS